MPSILRVKRLSTADEMDVVCEGVRKAMITMVRRMTSDYVAVISAVLSIRKRVPSSDTLHIVSIEGSLNHALRNGYLQFM
jgi:hypothetical protein